MRNSSEVWPFRHQFFIYGIERVDEKTKTYRIFGREYRSLGLPQHSRTTVPPQLVRIKGLTPARQRLISDKGCTFDESHSVGKIWLYGDAGLPDENKANWEAYCKRLWILTKLQIEEVC